MSSGGFLLCPVSRRESAGRSIPQRNQKPEWVGKHDSTYRQCHLHMCVSGNRAGSVCVNHRCAMPAPLSGFRFVGYNLPLTSATGQGDLRCPPNEQCPNCHRLVADWHVEWYKTEGPSLYQGLAALDCPLCRQPVGFQGGKIGPAPPGMPLITRQADQAAEWAASQAISAGGTLQAYTSVAGAQYAAYWTPQEVLQADAHRRAKQGGP